MIPRKKPAKPVGVTLEEVSPSVVEAVTPSWSAVFSQWATAASAIAVAVTLLGNIYLQHVQAKAALEQARSAAVKVEEVRTALKTSDAKTEDSLEEIKQTGEAVHVLVNSSMSAQLKISAVALKRIAVMTKDPDDIAAAELAEKLLKEHDDKQNKVDQKEK